MESHQIVFKMRMSHRSGLLFQRHFSCCVGNELGSCVVVPVRDDGDFGIMWQ